MDAIVGQQVEGVAGGVEPGLPRAGFRWRELARVGVVGVVEEEWADGEQADQVRQDQGGAVAVADGPVEEEAPGSAGPAHPPLSGVGPAGLLFGDRYSTGASLAPGTPIDGGELLIRRGV